MTSLNPIRTPFHVAVTALYLGGFVAIFNANLGDFLFFSLFGWVILGFALAYRSLTAHLRPSRKG